MKKVLVFMFSWTLHIGVLVSFWGGGCSDLHCWCTVGSLPLGTGAPDTPQGRAALAEVRAKLPDRSWSGNTSPPSFLSLSHIGVVLSPLGGRLQ